MLGRKAHPQGQKECATQTEKGRGGGLEKEREERKWGARQTYIDRDKAGTRATSSKTKRTTQSRGGQDRSPLQQLEMAEQIVERGGMSEWGFG